MHINHHRTNKFVGRKHNRRGWQLIRGSFRWYKANAARKRRALERRLIVTERYDEIPSRNPRTIRYDYW